MPVHCFVHLFSEVQSMIEQGIIDVSIIPGSATCSLLLPDVCSVTAGEASVS